MWLCVDCGNTRLKWGLHDGNRWLQLEALPLADLDHLQRSFSAWPAPSAAVACSVAGDEVRTAVENALGDRRELIHWVASQAEQCGVTSAYENPAQLGADRWAALIGARSLFRRDCVVVNAGTATTVDVLDRDGIFQGGLILPGIDLMRSSLFHNTARLPFSDGAFQSLPRNTEDAIASGILQATAGAIVGMYARIAGGEQPICLLTGGAATSLLPVLQVPWQSVDHLVLEGLLQIARRNE